MLEKMTDVLSGGTSKHPTSLPRNSRKLKIDKGGRSIVAQEYVCFLGEIVMGYTIPVNSAEQLCSIIEISSGVGSSLK